MTGYASTTVELPLGSLQMELRSVNSRFLDLQFRLPDDYWDTYPDKIMAVTAADVQRVARKYLDPETMQIVAVGDALKIQSVLEPYGPVAVYDSNGKPTSIPKP